MDTLSAPHRHRARGSVLPVVLLALAGCTARAQSLPQSSQLTLQVQAPLVLEDVVVLNSHNQPIHNLKSTDFTVTDDGKPVQLQSFDEHAAPTPAQQAAPLASAPKVPNLGVNVFTNYTPSPSRGTLNILVLDLLNTPPNDQAHVRQKMLKFLASLSSGTQLAIFGLNSRLYLLQGFTSDPGLLKAAVNATQRQNKVQPLNLQPNLTTNGANLEQEAADTASLLAGGGPDLEGFVAADNLLREGDREAITIATIDQLAHYLAALPGRKNLIWCSGQFPLKFIIPAPDPTHPETYHDFTGQIRGMDDLLSRSRVSMYPIDATGLVTNPDDDAMMQVQHAPVGGGPRTLGFLKQTVDDHAPMELVAEQTGGKAFFNSDDLASEVAAAIALGSNYYALSYTPPDARWDGKYHKVNVKVNVPGAHLSYRRGYNADNPTGGNHGDKQSQASAMQAAMLHGAPQPSELLFDIRAIPADQTTSKLSPGSIPDPKLMQPPYRTYTLDTLLDIHTLQMTPTSNGEYQGSLNLTVLVYNAEGEVVNTETRLAHLLLPPARYADVLAHGLSASGAIDVPVKGTYFIRIGMHDPASNRVGAVEIPVAALQSRQAMILASTRAPVAK